MGNARWSGIWRRGTAPIRESDDLPTLLRQQQCPQRRLFTRPVCAKIFNLLFVVTQTLARRHYIGCWFLAAGYKADWCGIPPFFLRIFACRFILDFSDFPSNTSRTPVQIFSRFALQMAHFTLFQSGHCNAVATTYSIIKKLICPVRIYILGFPVVVSIRALPRPSGHFPHPRWHRRPCCPGLPGASGFLISAFFLQVLNAAPQATSAMRGERRNCAAIKLVLFDKKVNTGIGMLLHQFG